MAFFTPFSKRNGAYPPCLSDELPPWRTTLHARKGTTAAEAAAAAGFSDQSHMQKLFKLHHGLTPRQFKQATIISEL
ncbi:helix-turn-helix domain-containing protein [Desulfovibrio sp. OttesenSCG-928-G15]|nr:helix-turn-helix domain-containing protein [Desulfovibrio sp. OttesenSCG-928-G15]